MPAPPSSDHGRTQTLLLISKLLDSQQSLSPFTLIIDSLEQSAKPLLREYIRRAARTKTRTIFVSFETLHPPTAATAVIRAHALTLASLTREIKAHTATDSTAKTLIILDTLHPLLHSTSQTASPQSFLLPLITPTTALLAVHHADVPLPPPANPYAPPPAQLTAFLATTVLTLHALPHVLAAEAARMRATPTPAAGLRESAEGTLRGVMHADASTRSAVVVEMEHRRRSGRVVGALFVLRGTGAGVRLLDEDPAWRELVGGGGGRQDGQAEEEAGDGLSFSLGLTEKQRRERSGVVLPYFDAQTVEGGPGEGGRILYEMGVEDDFDEEEDEI